jgi:hypothetical protein
MKTFDHNNEGSFSLVSWYSKIGDHSQEDLAKLGYSQDIKVKKLRILSYFGYFLEPGEKI